MATFINYSYLRHAIDRNLLLAKDIYNKLEGKEATTEWNEDVQYQNLVKAYDNVVQVWMDLHFRISCKAGNYRSDAQDLFKLLFIL